MRNVVGPRQEDRVSGRFFRDYAGVRYWFWAKRGYYVSQINGVQSLLHRVVYMDAHGPVASTDAIYPVDGDWENLSLENLAQRRRSSGRRERKHPVQEFNGIRYYRKPTGYYKAGIEVGGEYMHRAVWALHNGEIPAGHHIHHVDGDRANNEISNLELLSASDHSKHHAQGNSWVGSEENKRQLVAASGLAAAWHRSEEGRNWHSKHGRESWKKRARVEKSCEVCGKKYLTAWPNQSRFCHPNCKQTALRRRRACVRPDG